MSKLKKDQIIRAFKALGQQLTSPDEALSALINTEFHHNAWFTPENTLGAVTAIGQSLNEADLNTWLNKYPDLESGGGKTVGLILAGNIPLVGVHDVLCVLASGNQALIKASTQDARLIKQVLKTLVDIEPAFADSFIFVDRLVNFDAVIATGSNNSSRYFEYYFGKVPNIIRKNRNSVAILTGNETAEQLNNLGNDIFDHFGLGCRNVSKLLVPEGYNFNFFFESIESYQPIANHHKYNNNYDYNKSIYLVNGDKHLDNGFLLLKEDKRMASPLAVLFFEYYKDDQAVNDLLLAESENIQCIVSQIKMNVPNQVVTFGQSQHPALWDYADGIDTMDFLSNL
ncbi:acyl-CoA reductase [Mucilaginibacter mali]|uniref:Acyl-CoA reductase n=1 Tax=Mucilaginibacter mali TaxID=2740462 RepID=A0A7D4QJB9_9SPHI|nr:acyl-CoA reductase [Mucilaginibacter mali]QKJ29690.1 acyl-CoA reductase [Mucilaginibacter mali]